MSTSVVKKMTVFTLAMMTVAAVVSLRGLPMMAAEGMSMIFYIFFATFIFLIPASMVAAELGSAYSEGGVYTWCKEAFGSHWGFCAIWLQWIQNVVWYPTVLGYAAGALAYLFMDPELASNGKYTGAVILVVYWIATFIALAGTTVISKITQYAVILGTILPGILIIILALWWVDLGNPIAFMFPDATSVAMEKVGAGHPHLKFFPNITNLGNIAFLAGIVLLFAGVEVHAVHARELPAPAKQFPLAMFMASIVIFLLFLLGSLAVATVVPAKEISLTAGLMQAFHLMLDKFHLGFLSPIMGLLLAFGAIGGVLSWVNGPSRGLLETAKHGEMPQIMARVNANGSPTTLLYAQAIVVTCLGGLYFVMEDVSVAFFLLSAMTVTPYLAMYIIMYAAGLKLRFSQPDLPRPYRVPGGTGGMIFVSTLGLLGVIFALIVGFFPPTNLPVGNPSLYVCLVGGGLLFCVITPFIIQAFKKPSWMPQEMPKA